MRVAVFVISGLLLAGCGTQTKTLSQSEEAVQTLVQQAISASAPSAKATPTGEQSAACEDMAKNDTGQARAQRGFRLDGVQKSEALPKFASWLTEKNATDISDSRANGNVSGVVDDITLRMSAPNSEILSISATSACVDRN